MNESASDEIIRVLGEFFDQKIRFKEVITGWPDFSTPLKLPALSLVVKNAAFTPRYTEEVSHPKSSALKADVLYSVGEWTFTIQVDAWIKTKSERNDVFEKMFVALNSQSREGASPVLSLKMPKYHDQIATYTFEGYKYPDSGDSSASGEWRAILSFEAVCAAIVRRDNEPLIRTIEAPVDVTTDEII